MTVYVLPRWDNSDRGGPSYDVTTRGAFRALSPMVLGPVDLYDGFVSQNVENAWQFSKVYQEHAELWTGDPLTDYWLWAEHGWGQKWSQRYPMGREKKPLYTLWRGQRLDYIQARRAVYIPLYVHAAQQSTSYEFLRREVEFGKDIVLKDYDAYDHRALGYSWEDVINDPDRKMGHGFVLAMMLEGYL